MNDIFTEWKNRPSHKNKLFITDGIVDESHWGNSEIKVLFLLKEAYDSKRVEGSWDLPALICRKKVSGRTFKPMAQWAYGVQGVLKSHEILPFQQGGVDVELALLSSAVVNLKKSGGINKSSSKDLSTYVAEDWDLISKQIGLIKPQIVICGNTWSLVSKKITSKKISDRAYLSDGVIYISFWHPSNRASNLFNYYSLCALVQMAVMKLDVEL